MDDLLNFDEFGLNESYSQLAHTLRGLRPNISTVGIVTAENPKAVQASAEYNREKTAELVRYLSDARHGYRRAKGKYGNLENPVIITNISEGELLAIGARFNQDSVIFGKKVEEKDYTGMKFTMIGTYSDNYGEILGESDVFVSRKDAKDFYTEYKGRKFVIPFFGVEDIKTKLKNWDEIERREHDARWQGGVVPTTSKRRFLRHRETGREIPLDEYKKAERYLLRAATMEGSSAWHYRGMANKILRG